MAIAKTREDWERVWLFSVCLKKLRYSNARPTKFESLYHEQKYLEEENGKMVALQISSKIESLYGLPEVDRPQNYKSLYGILQLLEGSHLDNFPLKTKQKTMYRKENYFCCV